MVNKIKAIKFLAEKSKIKGFCFNSACNIPLNLLPVFDFHHPKPDIKSKKGKKYGFWKSVRFKPWDKIEEKLIKEDIIILCRNCHTIEGAKTFLKYKETIKKANLFMQDGKPIYKNIDLRDYEKETRNYIKYHIKKKIVVMDLFEGKCHNCEIRIDNGNIDSLPALEFHHTDQNVFLIRKKLHWYNLGKWGNIYRIKEEVKKQKMKIFCSNCHLMLKSTRYKVNEARIFSKYYLLKNKE